jgi:hypothetical protein
MPGHRPEALIAQGRACSARWGDGEYVGDVGVGAAGQGDVGVLAVLGAGDHRQAGVDGAALGGVVGDGVAEFGVTVTGVPEGPAGPAPLPGKD